MYFSFLVFSLLVFASTLNAADPPYRPHIMFFVIDDLGWSDVSYRGIPEAEISTPTIDHLATTGVILDKYYVQPTCTPTRAAFLSGRYPFTQGLQHFFPPPGATTAALPEDQPTVAEVLKQAGYQTSMIGKYHLGYSEEKQTPLGRGFDSFYGFLQGGIQYYVKNYTLAEADIPDPPSGLDWWRDRTPITDENEIYNQDLYDAEMLKVLDEYEPSLENPLFLYSSQQIVHTPLQAPPIRWFAGCAHLTDPLRRTYCAMTNAVDNSLSLLVEKLHEKGMWENTLLVVTSDNGAAPDISSILDVPFFAVSAGSNYPLRAGKQTLFDGGMRSIGFINGGVLPLSARGKVSNQLLHAVDWFPTFVSMTGCDLIKDSIKLDGIPNAWDLVVEQKEQERAVPLQLNVDEGTQKVLVTSDGWKLLIQNISADEFIIYDGYFSPLANVTLPPENPSGRYLFNLAVDPREMNNLYFTNQQKADELEALIDSYMTDYVPVQDLTIYPEGFPENLGGIWRPWIESDSNVTSVPNILQCDLNTGDDDLYQFSGKAVACQYQDATLKAKAKVLAACHTHCYHLAGSVDCALGNMVKNAVCTTHTHESCIDKEMCRDGTLYNVEAECVCSCHECDCDLLD